MEGRGHTIGELRRFEAQRMAGQYFRRCEGFRDFLIDSLTSREVCVKRYMLSCSLWF